MSIVSSTYTIDAHTQADGSKYVVEQHTDNTGKVYSFGPYIVASETLVANFIAARINKLNNYLAISEAESILTNNSTFVLQHQTAAEFAIKFWKILQDANKERFCYLIWWLYNRIVANDFTSNDIRLSYNNYFNRTLTLTQWNNLVTTRFIPARDRYQAILDEGPI